MTSPRRPRLPVPAPPGRSSPLGRSWPLRGARGPRSVLLPIAGALGVALVVASCAAESATSSREGPSGDFQGCVLGSGGGFRDRSFNQDIYSSAIVLEESLGIEVRAEEPTTPREAEQMLEELASPDSGCDLVIAMGTPIVRQVEAAAVRHPDQDFAIVDDDSIDLPNVRTIVFDATQPGFLAGYAAASVTETGRVGAYGGKELPEVWDFLDGYAAGVQHWNDVHDDDVELIGWDPESRTGTFLGGFSDDRAAARVTREQLDQGVDVIMPVAGRAGLGTTEEVARDGDALFVWVDVDGWDVLPDDQRTRQLTSVGKEIGPAVADVMTQAATSGFDRQPYTGTLANGGVGLGEYHDQRGRVGEETAQEIRDLRQQIIDGTLPTRPSAAP